MEPEIIFGILTVSDTCSQHKATDSSGDELSKIINETGKRIVKFRDCVPDDCDKIKEVLIKWSDDSGFKLDVIITTGGTGFAKRDVTPEATRQVIQKEVQGFSNAMLIESMKITPFAMMSRAICGIRGQTLIINVPGSKKASVECLSIVMGCIPHAVSLLRDKTDEIKQLHTHIQQGSGDGHNHHHPHSSHHNHNRCQHGNTSSQVDVSRVARRPREHSEYPMVEISDALNVVLDQAKQIIVEKLDFRDDSSRLKVSGCILAENVYANEPFPPFPASIKDGYAVIASDGAGPRKVIGDRVAGSSPDLQIRGDRICVRVNTGAPVPQEMDAVVQVEDTELVEEADDGRTEVSINVLTEPVVGQDIRCVGSDIGKGQMVMEKHTVITSTELGLLATLGINEIKVFKRPTIGILSTGDELQQPWTKGDPQPGCIRDSNKVTLTHLLKDIGFEAVDCGIAKDNPDDVYKKMFEALNNVDILITTGSVSMGERDLIKNILKTDIGAKIHFGRVNMKPGKPMTFATCKGGDGSDKLIFSLPGNPSSAIVTCHVFVIPTLQKLSGKSVYRNEEVVAELKERVVLDWRPELKRAILQLEKRSVEGEYIITASVTGNQISSRLASLRGANGLLQLPQRTPERTHLDVGTKINVYVIGRLTIG